MKWISMKGWRPCNKINRQPHSSDTTLAFVADGVWQGFRWRWKRKQ